MWGRDPGPQMQEISGLQPMHNLQPINTKWDGYFWLILWHKLDGQRLGTLSWMVWRNGSRAKSLNNTAQLSQAVIAITGSTSRDYHCHYWRSNTKMAEETFLVASRLERLLVEGTLQKNMRKNRPQQGKISGKGVCHDVRAWWTVIKFWNIDGVLFLKAEITKQLCLGRICSVFTHVKVFSNIIQVLEPSSKL